VLPELPLTASGKVDRRALPKPEIDTDHESEPPRDATELFLFSVWSELLGTENFGIRHNFFDLGGHSLMAVALSSRVGEVYGEKMSVRTVFDYPTVERLADYLRQEVSFLPPSALIPIQPRGTRPPFFCVHAASGLAHIFITLARCLGPDQPFYGLQSFDHDVEQIPDNTVEGLARQYLVEVRRVQPAGPYRIGGWSFGAVVAYEMAQQLHAAGERVSVLAMLDSIFSSKQVEDRPLTREELDVQLHELVVGYTARWLGLTADEIRSMPTRDLVQLNMRHHQEIAQEREFVGLTELKEIDYLRWFRNQVINAHASRRYQPQPYPGRLTLFRSKIGEDGDYGWSQWALSGVEVYYSESEHIHFIQAPNASVLAKQLANCFAKAE
jgi:thioesterase domain-containing protein/acyl carrier protein